MEALVTNFEYLANQPRLIFGSKTGNFARRSAKTSSETCKLIVRFGRSISIISPFSTKAIGPPSAASGEIWPIEIPRDAP